ncbi:MAG: hypothetical protein ACK5LP_01205 [Campylobacteraceae bacterium]
MQEANKDTLLLEISSLIKASADEMPINLEIMRFMEIDELINIKESLIRRKENRKNEQEDWYKEWTDKCSK